MDPKSVPGAGTRQDSRLPEIAVRLFSWSRTIYGTAIKDVFAWQNGKALCFALFGSSLKLERIIQSSSRNYRARFDYTLGKALGIEVEVDRNGYASPQFFGHDDISFTEIVEGVEGALREVLGEDTHVHFTVIPEGGEPYTEQPTPYFSAKTKRMHTSSPPPWVTTVTYRDTREDKEVTRPGANFCNIVPPLRTQPSGYGMVYFENRRERTPVILAHSLDLSHPRINDSTAHLIAQCGGLLFPSLSIGSIPAANFGPLVLVADPALALDGVKPWRKRGVWPVTIYSTDTWTMRTSDFVGYASAMLYDQLTGAWEITYYSTMHLWTLGPAVEHEGGPTAGRVISAVKPLASAVRQRMKPFLKIKSLADLKRHHAKSFDGRPEHAAGPDESWYGYLEVKANAVLPMSWFVAAFCPSWAATRARPWLHATGFTGTLYTHDTNDAIREAYNRDYADSPMSSDEADYQKLAWSQQVGEHAQQVLRAFTVSA